MAWAALVVCSGIGTLGCRSEAPAESHTIFYAPVISPDGQRMAYLKRLTRHRRDAGGGPLAGIAPMLFEDDHLYLCTAAPSGAGETCSRDWTLPLRKVSSRSMGTINAELAWEGDELRYRICLLQFETVSPKTCRDAGGNEGIAIANLPAESPMPPSSPPSGWRATLDPDPQTVSAPTNNRINIEPLENR